MREFEEHTEFLEFRQATDEALVERAHQGDALAEEYLYLKHKNFVRAKARSYFLVGADREDLVQEGMIGLYKAIRDYEPEKTGSFLSFAELCITRQIISAIKAATRQKHIPLNSYVSLNKPLYEDGTESTLIDVLTSAHVSDPEETVIGQESYAAISGQIQNSLSPLELETLNLYLDGLSYVEIAERLKRHPKAVDNALQRVRRKLEGQL